MLLLLPLLNHQCCTTAKTISLRNWERWAKANRETRTHLQLEFNSVYNYSYLWTNQQEKTVFTSATVLSMEAEKRGIKYKHARRKIVAVWQMSQRMWDYKNKLGEREKKALSVVRGYHYVANYNAYNGEKNECRNIFSRASITQKEKVSGKQIRKDRVVIICSQVYIVGTVYGTHK